MTPQLKRKTYLVTAIVVIANVLGNFLMSWGLHHSHHTLGGSALEYLLVLFNPWVAAGVALLILWLLSRMTLLSWADLSYVLPMTSVGYVLTAVVGWAVLGEHISATRWAGTLLIMSGSALVSSTAVRTTPASKAEEDEPEPAGARR